MKIYAAVVQGSAEWHRLRLGIPTASNFDRIFTPGGEKGEGKPVTGKARRTYLNELLCERLLGEPCNPVTTAAMTHGHTYEAEAVSGYELDREIETTKVGIVTNDEGTIGASPDRFVGEDGQLEVKCPMNPAIHLSYLMKHSSVAKEYKPQVQGQLWITERRWTDTLSYHPRMPEAVMRFERDEEYIAGLAEAVTLFSRDLEREWAELLERFPDSVRSEEVPAGNPFGISAEDEAVLVAHYRAEGLM